MSAAHKLWEPVIEILVFQDGKMLGSKKMTKFPILIGRSTECQFQVDSPYMSRRHCEVHVDGTHIVVKDLQSRNGIVLNGKKMPSLRFQDKVRFNVEGLQVEIRVMNPQVAAAAVASVRSSSEEITADVPTTFTVAARGARGKAEPVRVETSTGHHGGVLHEAITDADFHSSYELIHPRVLEAKSRKVEAILLWKNQVYEVREFFQDDKITVGASPMAALRVPVLPRGWALGRVDFKDTRCFVPSDMPTTLIENGESQTLSSFGNSKKVHPRKNGYVVHFKPSDVMHVDLGSEMKLVLRYVPTPPLIPRKEMFEPDWAFKRYISASALVHAALALALFLSAPPAMNVPKIENVPERYARLLVDPPKPVLPVPEPPPPPPEPPKPKKPEPPAKMAVVKKPAPEIPKPKRVAKKPPKALPQKAPQKQIAVTQAPTTEPQGAKTPTPVKEPPNLGALGALGALTPNSADNNAPAPVAIQIQKGGKAAATGASGPALPNMPQISGGGGALIAGNSGVLKTKLGAGQGGEYGVKGLKGRAGSRGVEGSVVGEPLLTAGGADSGLTRKQVMDVVQKHLAQVQTCYERSLLTSPDLNGRMEFEWDIQPTGAVSAVRVKRSSVTGGDGLSECVKGVFKKMKFPAAKNGQPTTPNIGFPFGRM